MTRAVLTREQARHRRATAELALPPAKRLEMVPPGHRLSTLEVAVIEEGKAQCERVGLELSEAFADTLEGDLCRMRAFRQLRRAWAASSERIWELIERHLVKAGAL